MGSARFGVWSGGDGKNCGAEFADMFLYLFVVGRMPIGWYPSSHGSVGDAGRVFGRTGNRGIVRLYRANLFLHLLIVGNVFGKWKANTDGSVAVADRVRRKSGN